MLYRFYPSRIPAQRNCCRYAKDKRSDNGCPPFLLQVSYFRDGSLSLGKGIHHVPTQAAGYQVRNLLRKFLMVYYTLGRSYPGSAH